MITLTRNREDNQRVTVHPDHVISYHLHHSAPYTVVVLTHGNFAHVQETPEQITKMIHRYMFGENDEEV